MIESFIGWLADLPAVAIYLVIALLAFIENIVPPFPADVAIALGAFLSHRGITEPWLVFGVTIVANIGGAMTMYGLASRHAERLLESGMVRRIFPMKALPVIQNEYRRWGLIGIFIGRLLPGVRAVVAPFAGLIRLGWLRAMIPMALASAIWYGGIVFGAARVARHFDEVRQYLGEMNRTLLLVTAGLLLAGLGWWWLYRRRKNRVAA